MSSILPIRIPARVRHIGGLGLLCLGLTAGVLPARAAADAPPPPERGARAAERMKHMAKVLGLTDDQKAKIGDILHKQMDQLMTLRDDDTKERREKFKEMRKIQEEGRAQIRALLTPEQQKKFDEMPRPGPGRRHRDGDGAPDGDGPPPPSE